MYKNGTYRVIHVHGQRDDRQAAYSRRLYAILLQQECKLALESELATPPKGEQR